MASCVSSGNDKKKDNQLIVVAIDFGTTYTGFAYSFFDKPYNIFTSTWSGENLYLSTSKAPTCVLLSPEKEFVAFGYEAEENYRQLIEEDRENKYEDNECKAKEHYFFQRFKMKLYQTKKLQLDTKIADMTGKELPAIDVFAAVISHIKYKLQTDMRNRYAGFQEEDVLWVITVPAIWSDAAKQFMKEAAKKAGIEGDVKLILEPEAASLYCNSQRLCKTARFDDSVQVDTFPVGHNILLQTSEFISVVKQMSEYSYSRVVGPKALPFESYGSPIQKWQIKKKSGTADLSVHEILPDKNLREIHRADGDALGGTTVDQEFFAFLEQVLGRNVIRILKERFPDLVMDIQLFFETKKRLFDPDKRCQIKLEIPWADLDEIIKELKEEPLERKIEQAATTYGKENLKLMTKKLYFGSEIMESFFRKATDGIINFINKMRKDDTLGTINTLVLVGGFAESRCVQNAIKRQVPGVRIIVPAEPSLAVLKGAVIIGRNPKVITERIARFTYGFSFANRFEPGVHPEELKITRNGMKLCSSIFKKLITKGDVLKVGDHFGVPAVHLSLSNNLFEMRFMSCMPLVADLYRSNDTDPKYTKEGYGCDLIGLVVIPPPENGWPPVSEIYQELVVGEAEFTVRAINKNTKQIVEGKIDFLSSLPRNSTD